MIRRPPRSTRTDTLFPTRRSSDLAADFHQKRAWRCEGRQADRPNDLHSPHSASYCPSVYHDQESQSRYQASESTPSRPPRSEEHTSELQSLMRISYAVFCLKKKHEIT